MAKKENLENEETVELKKKISNPYINHDDDLDNVDWNLPFYVDNFSYIPG